MSVPPPPAAPTPQPPSVPSAATVDRADQGYAQALKTRHVRMIAIGGSIGTGLFLGAGGRLSAGGPSLAFVYALCGVFTFFMMRTLGEMAVYRPSSGAFVSYAREFMGERGAYVTGWLFFLDWCTSVMAETTAIALYFHFWEPFKVVPQWLLAFIALALIFGVNLLSVKYFGEAEFWFAMIKVAAIVGFMLTALVFVLFRLQIHGQAAGPSLIGDNGGFFPNGWTPMVTLALGVVFAFGGTEMVGVAAGEAQNAQRIIPKAVNSTFWRIALFYVGSVILFTMVLPWTTYSAAESPFVTFFGALGIGAIGSVMNVVVITAALSSLNGGLFATGRTLRSMAVAGSAPKVAARLNRHKVPAGGISITAGLALVGVLINYIAPTHAFEIVMNLAGIGIAGTWISIMVSHMIFVRKARNGELERPAYRLWAAPFTNLLTIAFLVFVICAMWFADTIGKPTILTFLGICVALAVGWFAIRGRIDAAILDEAFDAEAVDASADDVR